jgi:hypothetical protein
MVSLQVLQVEPIMNCREEDIALEDLNGWINLIKGVSAGCEKTNTDSNKKMPVKLIFIAER